MQRISVVNPGAEYQLVLTETDKPVPQAGEVLIRVIAAGINRADIMQAWGQYPPPPGASDTLGLEVSGVIEAVGPDAHGTVGQTVCALIPGGGYAEYAVASHFCVLPVPTGVDAVAAAGLPETFFTVWTNLIDTAHLQPGETLLVHGGASGIGTTAIQIANALGNPVFVTAGGDAGCQACVALGARRAINYRSEDFVAVLMEQTQGRGVDVILDMVGGDYVRRNFAAAAKGGRIVNIAYQNGRIAEADIAIMLAKQLTWAATGLRGRAPDAKGAIRDALLARLWPCFADGTLRPMVDAVFPLADAMAAHRAMGGAHLGKILLRV